MFKKARRGVWVAAVASVAAVGPPSAHAADITCQLDVIAPPAHEIDFEAGRIFRQDAGVVPGRCYSLTHTGYSIRLTAKTQSYDGATWHDVPGCAQSQSGVSTGPVAHATVVPVCNVGEGSPHVDRCRRVVATLWNSVDGRVITASGPYSCSSGGDARQIGAATTL